ncbi:MAG: F0F1 ATP synthase subunit A [Chthoniobacteraceae bacterium]|jgi:F-type H+-transporting ATPase subunit a
MKRLCRHFLPLLLLALGAGAPIAAHAAEEGGGLTLNAPQFHVGPITITNSMLETWIVAVVIIVFAQIATRSMKEVPEGAQNFCEWLVEGLYNFLESIVGHQLVKKTFWLFASLFILIVFSNWFGLIPGIGTIGFGPPTGPMSIAYVREPLFRGANADLNMTFAMAMVFFLMWTIWAFQANGFGGFIMHLFGPKGESKGILMKAMMIVIFFLVGILECISILVRPIALSLRLFGNIFAGENMLETTSNMVQHPMWLKDVCSVVIPIPFYFMEIFVGLVQALVFMLLCACFTLLICQHPDEGHGIHPH